MRELTAQPQRQPDTTPLKPPRRVPRPTEHDISTIQAAYESGRTIRDIAHQLGFHRETISKTLHDAGIATRYHQAQCVDLDVADHLIKQGNTITQTALTMGISRSMLIRARAARRQAASV